MAIFAIIVGCIAIAVACFGKKFYAADVWGGSVGNKPIPKWQGRLIFLFVGILFIVCGITCLLNHPPSIHLTW